MQAVAQTGACVTFVVAFFVFLGSGAGGWVGLGCLLLPFWVSWILVAPVVVNILPPFSRKLSTGHFFSRIRCNLLGIFIFYNIHVHCVSRLSLGPCSDNPAGCRGPDRRSFPAFMDVALMAIWNLPPLPFMGRKQALQ